MKFCKHRVMDRCKKDDNPCIFNPDCFEPEEEKPMTNADRIRSMDDEQLAAFLLFFIPTTFDKAMYTGVSGKYDNTSEEAYESNLKWLQQPAEEDDHA